MANETPGKATTRKSEAGSKSAVSLAAADPISMLKADHRQVEQMFRDYEEADADRKSELVEQICKALTLHTLLEEELFYPACREGAAEEEPLDEAQVEHDGAKILIADLRQGKADDRYRDAKVKVLAEQIRHHVAEEEKPRSGIFAKAQQGGVNTSELGTRIRERRTQLEGQDELPAGTPVSLSEFPRAIEAQSKESEMASREQTRERDDRGRFIEDDDRRGGSRGRGRDDDDRSYSSRGSGNRDRDDEGRFTSGGGGRRSSGRDDDDRSSRGGNDGRGWYGDSRGHAEAARRGWDDRDDARSRSRGYDDDDDDDRGGRGRGRGGWFGDSEGHSEAARRGWDDQGSSRSSRGGRDDDDDDRGGRGRGQGGWFGDSEGHSEAARRGWDDRGSSRSSRGGRDDDDDRGGRSSRGRDDDDRGRNQGGWFGDSRGHAEAARRGWENRR